MKTMVNRERCAEDQYCQTTRSTQVPCDAVGGIANIEPLQRGEIFTFGEWADLWLGSCRSRLRPSTCHAYEKALKRLRPIIGSLNLSDLTPVVLFAVVAGLDKHGRRAAQESYTVLRTCLQAAADVGVIPDNPMVKVQKPRWEPIQREYWGVQQTHHFIEHALQSPRRWAPLCVFLVTMGLRVSEALGLTWSDVDVEGRRVLVRKTLVHVDVTHLQMAPKTKTGRKWTALHTTALAALRRVTQRNRSQRVFTTQTDKPQHGTTRTTLLALC
jgi:integrase